MHALLQTFNTERGDSHDRPATEEAKQTTEVAGKTMRVHGSKPRRGQ